MGKAQNIPRHRTIFYTFAETRYLAPLDSQPQAAPSHQHPATLTH
jgi:hypothetical protein